MIKRIIIILSVLSVTLIYTLYQKNALDTDLSENNSTEHLLKKLPQSSFNTLDGKLFNLAESSVLINDLSVVHFWGTWCAPCESELPEFLNFIKSHQQDVRIKFYLIAVNDDPLKVKKQIKDLNLSNVVWLLDNNGEYKDSFGSTRVPETYVFSKDGYLIKKFLGPQDWQKQIYHQLFQEYLQISSQKM
jgi:cytochrome c biogenesis protein CcmG/thiol:disulfide interchange protein DsbE